MNGGWVSGHRVIDPHSYFEWLFFQNCILLSNIPDSKFCFLMHQFTTGGLLTFVWKILTLFWNYYCGAFRCLRPNKPGTGLEAMKTKVMAFFVLRSLVLRIYWYSHPQFKKVRLRQYEHECVKKKLIDRSFGLVTSCAGDQHLTTLPLRRK